MTFTGPPLPSARTLLDGGELVSTPEDGVLIPFAAVDASGEFGVVSLASRADLHLVVATIRPESLPTSYVPTVTHTVSAARAAAFLRGCQQVDDEPLLIALALAAVRRLAPGTLKPDLLEKRPRWLWAAHATTAKVRVVVGSSPPRSFMRRPSERSPVCWPSSVGSAPEIALKPSESSSSSSA